MKRLSYLLVVTGAVIVSASASVEAQQYYRGGGHYGGNPGDTPGVRDYTRRTRGRRFARGDHALIQGIRRAPFYSKRASVWRLQVLYHFACNVRVRDIAGLEGMETFIGRQLAVLEH
jgi:hypothetical protein